MKVLRVTNGFADMPDPVLLLRGRVIHGAMLGNPNFLTPSPSLTDINSTLDSFEEAIEKADGGNRQDIAVKNAIRETLINQLHLLGNYVMFIAANNEVVASSSAFRIGKTAAPQPPMTTPGGLQLKNGVNKGELKFSFKRVAGARNYRYEITPSPVTENSVREASLNTVTKKLYTGLESGKEYNCRVIAYGIKEQAVYSDVVSKFTL